MARFKPGKSGNPEGRPKGAKNRTTEQLRDALRDFINDNFEDLQTAYNSLKAPEKLRFINDVLKHVLCPPVNPANLSEDQLRQVAEYFIKIYGNDKTKRN